MSKEGISSCIKDNKLFVDFFPEDEEGFHKAHSNVVYIFKRKSEDLKYVIMLYVTMLVILNIQQNLKLRN